MTFLALLLLTLGGTPPEAPAVSPETPWPPHHAIDQAQGAGELARCRSTWETAHQWRGRRGRIRGHLAGTLGIDLDTRRPLVSVSVTGTREAEGYTVSNLLVETAPGVFISANLYEPAGHLPPWPAVLCAHGHYGGSATDGPGRFRGDQQRLCATLARSGAVALTWDMVGWGESTWLPHAVPASTSLQTWNSIRMVDWLTTRDDIDPDRIAMTGSSGGGTQTFLASALDDRIAASAPIVMVSAHFFGGCACESGLPIHHGPNHRTNTVEIAACAAPRPQLLVSCGGDWTVNTPDVEFPYLQAVYAALGAADLCENAHFPDEGHDLGMNKRMALYDFLARHIGIDPVQTEQPVEIRPRAALAAISEDHPLPAHACRSHDESVERIAGVKGEPDRPNVVIVLADDLGWGDPGCYNPDSKIPTPAIDRLAGEGMRFTDAHSPSAVCTPTRYGLLTGRYAWRTDLKSWVLGGYSPLLIDPATPTIASMLDKSGYQTAVVGKWHLGLGPQDPADFDAPLRPGPLELGFDECHLIPASLDMPPYCWVVDDAPETPPTDETPGSKHRRQGGGGMWRAGAMSPGFEFDEVLTSLADRAVAFIEEAAPGDEPFMLYMPLTAPHTPWVPSEEFTGRTSLDHYGDFVAQTDGVLGDVLDAIDRTGSADNTIVVFASDNGAHWRLADIDRYDHLSNGHWRGMKADIHEGGHRVPMVVRWPGTVPRGTTSDELVCLTDLHATLAAATGSPRTGGSDSRNMLPTWRGAHLFKPLHDGLVLHSGDGMYAIRAGDWKLIEGLGSGGFTRPKRPEPEADGPTGQLYNLAEDPGEATNLWLERPEVVQRLTTMLDGIRSRKNQPTANLRGHSR